MTVDPSSRLVGKDIPGPAVSDYLGAVRTLRKVDQRAFRWSVVVSDRRAQIRTSQTMTFCR